MSLHAFHQLELRHGTRSCYVRGCRCAPCTAANLERYHTRQAAIREGAVDVKPTGAAIAGTLVRAGKTYRVRRCPGANGETCVRGGAWLRGKHDVCGACVERCTVWDGLVSTERARAHLLELSRVGVGYKAVGAACDVSKSTLFGILKGEPQIRAHTERAILAVDAGAIADGARVSADRMNAMIAAMRLRGFTLGHLGELLGYQNSVLQLGKWNRAKAATVARVERLMRRIERGEVEPRRVLIDAQEERAWIAAMIERGLSAAWLSKRLGFFVSARDTARRMWPKNVAAVRALRDELEELRREGTGLPEDWAAPDSALQRIGAGFGFDGGFLVRGGTNGKSGRRLKHEVAQEMKAARRGAGA